MFRWIENHLLTCPFKAYFNVECFGCGMQRSLLALLQGNFMESILLYPALFPLLGMFCYLAFHLVFKFEYGATVLKYFFGINAVIILVNGLLKIVNIGSM